MFIIHSNCLLKCKCVACCRCQTEYEQRDAAVNGDAETQKKFHSFVLFLGELYLHLEVRDQAQLRGVLMYVRFSFKQHYH